ncbi:proline-rich receptor-like protein kinase PERK2 [Iris pallida]|uniref:Proline-rich receptor-like protein kinase PERK2 n=1 Tax=Iris pallida TaxID=29817 RepID=A0AAX6G2V0_IRIPA|nr:proline-rich receptor-like protein kinase PERK2 [Iris pallida]
MAQRRTRWWFEMADQGRRRRLRAQYSRSGPVCCSDDGAVVPPWPGRRDKMRAQVWGNFGRATLGAVAPICGRRARLSRRRGHRRSHRSTGNGAAVLSWRRELGVGKLWSYGGRSSPRRWRLAERPRSRLGGAEAGTLRSGWRCRGLGWHGSQCVGKWAARRRRIR